VDGVRLQDFVAAAGKAIGLSDDRATLLADLLVTNDLRGVFSHGSQQIARYVREIGSGQLNPTPRIAVVRETPTSLLVDGDGGLGYFPCYEGTHWLVERALAQGIAVLATRNHGHFGAAGIYARIPLCHDLITFVTSGHQLDLQPGEPLIRAGGGSPMAFSAPAREEESLVLDFGALHGLYRPQDRDRITEIAPSLVLRCIGMGEICQSWGGLLTGLTMDPERTPWTFGGANQGALVMTFRIDLFADPDAFKDEMDEYVRRVRQLEPLPGSEQAYTPGGVEAARRAEYYSQGIPISPWHQERLEEVAGELGMEVPWADAANTPPGCEDRAEAATEKEDD